jgi:hypothetical protein
VRGGLHRGGSYEEGSSHQRLSQEVSMEREMFAIEEEPTRSKKRRSSRREVLCGSLPTGSRDRRAGVGARKRATVG